MVTCRSCGGQVFKEYRTTGFVVQDTPGGGTQSDGTKIEIRCAGCNKKVTLGEAAQIRKTDFYRNALHDHGMVNPWGDGGSAVRDDDPVGRVGSRTLRGRGRRRKVSVPA